MRRVSVVGTSGSGKSTLARELARRLGGSWLELDSVYHLAEWTPFVRLTSPAAARRFLRSADA